MENYTFLKATITQDLEERTSRKKMTHMNYIMEAKNGLSYQLNVDVQSKSTPNVRVFVLENFQENPLFKHLNNISGSCGPVNLFDDANKACRVDLVRSGLFTPAKLAAADFMAAKDTQDLLDARIKVGSTIFAIGEMYGPTIPRREDAKVPHGVELCKQFDSLPNHGIHMVHFNQGDPEKTVGWRSDGIFQDGCLILVNADCTATGFFFMFDTQSPYTDDAGHPIESRENVPVSPNEIPTVCR